MPDIPDSNDRGGVAFLLAQIGAHAADRFAARLAPLKLRPAHAGILRIIDLQPGLSQQALAGRLGMFPSRLVLILDELQEAGLVERRKHTADRRAYALALTASGRQVQRTIGRIAREHENAVCAALKPAERRMLGALLGRIADEQGLTPGVHPGYRKIGRRGRPVD